MNLQEFQQASKRTMPFNGEPGNRQEFENVLGNYSMGLVGEWFELQTVLHNTTEDNVEELNDDYIKECGDILHYAVGLLTVLGEEIKEDLAFLKTNIKDAEESLGNVLEIPKKHIYHRHKLNKHDLITAVYEVIRYLCHYLKNDVDVILQINIDKLKQRYPETFNTADSIARVDVVEGKA